MGARIHPCCASCFSIPGKATCCGADELLAEEETGKQTANKDNISSDFILFFKASIKSFGSSEHKVINSVRVGCIPG